MSPLLTYNTETTGIVYLHLEVSDKKKFYDLFRSFAPMRARTADLRLKDRCSNQLSYKCWFAFYFFFVMLLFMGFILLLYILVSPFYIVL